uniref:F-box domain-containing protein n=1 Tax=Pithovirus LCPAC403 TaxID=2506596 RepID=A0A481ZBX6_9VIRU|nr:MAG: hypothetical protein LCPAC403_02900 [Pithovirus LCPAC403]
MNSCVLLSEIFTFLTVGEILKIVNTNSFFNKQTKEISLWKNIVNKQYGVDKPIYSTWKKMAFIMYQSNMIKMNKIWIDDITYSDIFKEALENKNRYFFSSVLLSHNITSECEHTEGALTYAGATPKGIYVPKTEEELQCKLKVITREFSVIAHAFEEMVSIDRPGNIWPLALLAGGWNMNINVMNDKLQVKSRNIKLLIDPVLHVMTYSLLDIDALNSIRAW